MHHQPMDQLEVVAQWVKQARRVVYLCGAGLSVPSGIRAYRSGANAVWGEYVLEWGTIQEEIEKEIKRRETAV